MTTDEMGIWDKLRAAGVTRWHIVKTHNKQSLAEHSFNVAMIAVDILRRADLAEKEKEAAWIALHHDLDEVITGDIPTPMKSPIVKAELAAMSGMAPPVGDEDINAAIKFADLFDSVIFLLEEGASRHAVAVMGMINKQISDLLDTAPEHIAEAAKECISKIMSEDFTICQETKQHSGLN